MSNTSLSHDDPAAYWAGRINRDLRSVSQAAIRTGQTLLKAKKKLAHGQWGALFANGLIPISERVAQMFMAIARHPILSNPNHGSHLPPAWRTVYELTRVDDETLTYALEDGRIHPGMERKDVTALLPPKHAAAATKNAYRDVQDRAMDHFNAMDDPAEQARFIDFIFHLGAVLRAHGPVHEPITPAPAVPSWLQSSAAAVGAPMPTEDDDEGDA
jgi:hypothetical protein